MPSLVPIDMNVCVNHISNNKPVEHTSSFRVKFQVIAMGRRKENEREKVKELSKVYCSGRGKERRTTQRNRMRENEGFSWVSYTKILVEQVLV